MSDTKTVLAAISVAAERLMYSPLDWVVIGTEQAATTTATVPAVATKQHIVVKAVVSFSAAPAGVLTFTIKDGSTTIFQAEIPAATTAPAVYDFSTRPLHGSTNTALTGNLATAGGTTVQTIWMGGLTVAQP